MLLDARGALPANHRAAPVDRVYDETRSWVLARARVPLSTYRIQFSPTFRFPDAQDVVPYLQELGVTDLYASPYWKACAGSTHGYDVLDHNVINPELGTVADHAELCARLKQHNVGQVVDFVPNHMGIGKNNALWQDVLENGPASLSARWFDIDWNPLHDALRGKVLLPILGDQYGVVLERGELRLQYQEGAFSIHYYEHCFPVALKQYGSVLGFGLDELAVVLGSDHPDFIELQSILTAISHLPARHELADAKRVERNREKEVVKRRLRQLAASPAVRRHIDRNVEVFNGHVDDPRSFDRLDALLDGCSYRLAHWRVAGEEINYRRFFDVNTLAAVRVEDPEVFSQMHRLLFDLLAEEKVTGVRIDHPDGLFDPTAYFHNLQVGHFLAIAKKRFLADGGAPDAWPALQQALTAKLTRELTHDVDSPLRRALYVVVEKIQGGKERIPDAWAVHGTTGYRFANVVNGIFVERENEAHLTETYAELLGEKLQFHELVYQKKKLIMGASLASELNVLAHELNRISEMNRRTRDFTINSLRRALVEFIALFPVYRTYVDGTRPEVDERDVQYVEWAIARAKRRDPTTNASIFDFLRDILLRRYPDHLGERERAVMLHFAMKLQQVTGPVMAKGLEDTVFYIYNRLVSLNEVGGEPERFGNSVATFHLRNQERALRWPGSFLATTTHDTKRSEDVRARINVLSELPDEWRACVRKWTSLCACLKTEVGEAAAPDPNDEFLFYQTVLGAWPMEDELSRDVFETFIQRVREYMHKAIREAKIHTSWVNPVAAYENATLRFVEAALRLPQFLEDVVRFKRRLQRPGQLNSLSQVILKIASPGTVDTYQSTELWDLSLVDPDNRRPVDFALRWRLLQQIDEEAANDREPLCRRLWAAPDDGRIKLYVLATGLRLRRRIPELFLRADYHGLEVTGPKAAHVVAVGRSIEGKRLVAVVPRLVSRIMDESGALSDSFQGTCVQLPSEWGQGERFRDALTGRRVSAEEGAQGPFLDVGRCFSVLPVALLVRGDD